MSDTEYNPDDRITTSPLEELDVPDYYEEENDRIMSECWRERQCELWRARVASRPNIVVPIVHTSVLKAEPVFTVSEEEMDKAFTEYLEIRRIERLFEQVEREKMLDKIDELKHQHAEDDKKRHQENVDRIKANLLALKEKRDARRAQTQAPRPRTQKKTKTVKEEEVEVTYDYKKDPMFNGCLRDQTKPAPKITYSDVIVFKREIRPVNVEKVIEKANASLNLGFPEAEDVKIVLPTPPVVNAYCAPVQMRCVELCRNFCEGKTCRNRFCNFAHSYEQLNKRPCKFGKACKYGKTCNMWHPNEQPEQWCKRRGIEVKPVQTLTKTGFILQRSQQVKKQNC